MADLLFGSSQSSLLRLHPKLGFVKRTNSSIQLPQFHRSDGSHSLSFSSDRLRHYRGIIAARLVSTDSTKLSSSTLANCVDSANKGIDFEPEIGSGGDHFGSSSGGHSGGGGGDGGRGDSGKEDGGEASDGSKRKMALSMSQKLTLGYAALVGVGGLMGYLKSGSQKSLLAGGLSAAALFYVFRELPTNPVFASSIGILMSAVLAGTMGSRFLRSRKLFPAGVVSFISLIMTGGYIHGIMRSLH